LSLKIIKLKKRTFCLPKGERITLFFSISLGVYLLITI